MDVLYDVTCDICGKAFKTQWKTKRVCSKVCKAEYRRIYKRQFSNKKIKKFQLTEVPCKYCGEMFTQHRWNSSICYSDECQERKRKERYFDPSRAIPIKAYNPDHKSMSSPRVCICPRCQGVHLVDIFWTGRTIPRIFCDNCKARVRTIERQPNVASVL